MTIEQQTAEGQEVIETDEAGNVKDPAWYRDKMAESGDEIKTLRKELFEVRLKGIGLNPNDGLGKAIAKEYKGEMTTEALTQYATEEYGYIHESGEPETDTASELEDKQEAADSVQSMSTPTEPTEPLKADEYDEALADPEATQDVAKASIAHKVGEFMKDTYDNQ